MKGLILAGGLGTRLRPLSHTGPKQLIPIANKPVLHYVVEDLKNSGIEEIGVIVGYTNERIQKIKGSLGDGSKWDVKITYIRQDAPMGLAHAVGIAKEFIDNDNFVVYLGDNILKEGIKDFVSKFENSGADASLLLTGVDNPKMYGTAVLNKENEVIHVEEKPENPKSNLAIIGIYLFKECIFDAIKDTKPGRHGELQLTDAISKLVQYDKYKVTGHIVKGWWDDTGTTEAVLRANHLVLMGIKSDIKGSISKDAQLIGNIVIGENSRILESCSIKGPIIIGENCTIGPNTYIGPYTSIGNNVTIKNSEIESSVILDNVEIEFKNKIIESLIGKETKIGANKKSQKGYRLILGEHSEVYS